MFCPVCENKGCKTKLTLKQINFSTAVYMCPDVKCTYPVGYEWIMVTRSLDDMNKPQEEFEEQLKSQQNPANFSNVEVIDFDQWLNEAFSSDVASDSSSVQQVEDVFDMLQFDNLLSGTPLSENNQIEAVSNSGQTYNASGAVVNSSLETSNENEARPIKSDKNENELKLNDFELAHSLISGTPLSKNIKITNAAVTQSKGTSEILELNQSVEKTVAKNKINAVKSETDNKVIILNNILLNKNVTNNAVTKITRSNSIGKIMDNTSDKNKISPVKSDTDNKTILKSELSEISVTTRSLEKISNTQKKSPENSDMNKNVNLLNFTTLPHNSLGATSLGDNIQFQEDHTNTENSNVKESIHISIVNISTEESNDTSNKVKILNSIVLPEAKICELNVNLDVNTVGVAVKNKKPKKDSLEHVLKLVETSKHFETIFNKKT